MVAQSTLSMEATDSMSVCTGHHTKCCRNSSRMRGTCTKRFDRPSRNAPNLSAFNPLTPWQGGPAPSKTKVHCENWVLHCFTISASMSWTSLTTITPGKWVSTTRCPTCAFSADTYPRTWTPMASRATLRAPMPSKRPTANTAWPVRDSGTSPRRAPLATICPNGVVPRLTQTPPPESEASLQVTRGCMPNLKSRRASGRHPKKRRISI